MPIGRFAQAARLSVKSLRNYDASGLLPAAFVDPQSGYRYYRTEQLARADAIRSLRMVDMPLAQIVETLDGDNSEQVLMSHLTTLENQRDEFDRMAQQLRDRIQRKEFTMSTEITVTTLPALVVAMHRTKTTHTEIFADVPAGFGKVMTFLTQAGINPVATPFTMYYQAPDAETSGDIAMCVPVASIIDGNDDVVVLELAATTTASVVHKGSYDNMGESYAAVATWIHKHGHHITGPQREVYLNNPAEVAEDELLTEIHFSIDGQDQA